jgi:hypothetical protein
MQPGDNQQMEGTSPFEADAGAALQPDAVAGDHGGEHRGVFGVQPKEAGIWRARRYRRRLGERHESLAGSLLRGLQSTREGCVYRYRPRRDRGNLRAGQHADSLPKR